MSLTISGLLASLLLHSVAQPEEPTRPSILGEVPATTIRVGQGSVSSVVIAPDGRSVACVTDTGSPVVVSFPGGKVLHKFDVKRDEPCNYVAFTPDGKRLIGAWYGLRVWDLETGKLVISETWDWERRFPTGRGFDPQTGRPLRPSVEPPPRPAVSPDGKRLYVGGSDNDFRVIDTGTGKELKRVRFLGKPATSFAPAPDGKTLAVTIPDALLIFRTDTFAETERVELPEPRGSDRYAVRFPAGSDRLFVLGPSGPRGKPEIRVWDCDKARFALTLPPVWANDHFRPVGTAVTVVGDGRYALVCPNEGSRMFGLYDLKEGRHIGVTRTKMGHDGPLALTPDGKHLIGSIMSDDLVVIKVEDVLKLIPKDAPAKKP